MVFKAGFARLKKAFVIRDNKRRQNDEMAIPLF